MWNENGLFDHACIGETYIIEYIDFMFTHGMVDFYTSHHSFPPSSLQSYTCNYTDHYITQFIFFFMVHQHVCLEYILLTQEYDNLYIG
jgi:hypothetical protein